MKKTKLLGLASLLLSLGVVGCGEAESGEPKWENDENVHYHLDENGNKIDSARHTFEEDPTKSKASTCKDKGYKADVCKVCGYEKHTDLKLEKHKYVEDTSKRTEPTCTTAGVKKEYCSVCNDENVVPLNATGHDTETEATAKDGVEKITCKKNDLEAYELDITKATGWNDGSKKWNEKTNAAKMKASWDVSGVIPDGKYQIEILGRMSASSHTNRKWYNMAKAELCINNTVEESAASSPDVVTESDYRYYFSVNETTTINPNVTKNWGDLGYEGGDEAPLKYGLIVSEVDITGATTFEAYHGNIGYSMIVNKIRLTKIA